MDTQTPHAPITVKIGPNDWELTYTYHDFAEAERRLKMPLLPGSEKSKAAWEAMTPTQELAVTLFVGICKKNPLLKLEHIEDLVTYENMADLNEKSGTAFRRDLKPLLDKAEAGEPEIPLSQTT